MTDRRRSVRAAAGAALAAGLLVTTAACGSSGGSDTKADSKPSAAAGDSATTPPDTGGGKKDGLKLPDTLPTSIKDVKDWKWDDWSNWASQQHFKNPRIEKLWSTARMKAAKAMTLNTASATSGHSSQGDPPPGKVGAVKAAEPYNRLAYNGKLFFDAPEGHMVCSGTVVTDPQHPGKSNLVWTAGHCVHGGKSGGWYRNIAFVPGYDNNNGQRTAQQVEPYGVWWANLAGTSSQWMHAPSAHQGSAAAAHDFGVLRVVPPRGVHRSLEETVGGAVSPWFNAPKYKNVTNYGYPQAPPFNGQYLYSCTGRTTQAPLYSSRANMQWKGCSMTPGASGGGWFTKHGGKTYLVGDNSLTDAGHTWFSSPWLGDTAKQVYLQMARHR